MRRKTIYTDRVREFVTRNDSCTSREILAGATGAPERLRPAIALLEDRGTIKGDDGTGLDRRWSRVWKARRLREVRRLAEEVIETVAAHPGIGSKDLRGRLSNRSVDLFAHVLGVLLGRGVILDEGAKSQRRFVIGRRLPVAPEPEPPQRSLPLRADDRQPEACERPSAAAIQTEMMRVLRERGPVLASEVAAAVEEKFPGQRGRINGSFGVLRVRGMIADVGGRWKAISPEPPVPIKKRPSAVEKVEDGRPVASAPRKAVEAAPVPEEVDQDREAIIARMVARCSSISLPVLAAAADLSMAETLAIVARMIEDGTLDGRGIGVGAA